MCYDRVRHDKKSRISCWSRWDHCEKGEGVVGHEERVVRKVVLIG